MSSTTKDAEKGRKAAACEESRRAKPDLSQLEIDSLVGADVGAAVGQRPAGGG